MAIPYPTGCLPANLRKIQQYLDIASDYETMDVSVSYWCRLYALQQGFILQGGKEDLDYLLDLMKWVGEKKEELKSQKTVSDLCEARIHLENVAVEFLKWAETANQLFPVNQFNKIVLGAFFSAETLLDVCSVFGELIEEMTEKKKYIALHLANVGNCQYLFNSAGKTNSVTQELNSKMPWSPEGKKIYNRDSLLELRNKPASQILPENCSTMKLLMVFRLRKKLQIKILHQNTRLLLKSSRKMDYQRKNPSLNLRRCESDLKKTLVNQRTLSS